MFSYFSSLIIPHCLNRLTPNKSLCSISFTFLVLHSKERSQILSRSRSQHELRRTDTVCKPGFSLPDADMFDSSWIMS